MVAHEEEVGRDQPVRERRKRKLKVRRGTLPNDQTGLLRRGHQRPSFGSNLAPVPRIERSTVSSNCAAHTVARSSPAITGEAGAGRLLRPAPGDFLAHRRLDLGRRIADIGVRLRELRRLFPLQRFEILKAAETENGSPPLPQSAEVALERSPDRGVVAGRLGPGADRRDNLGMTLHREIALLAGGRFDKADRPRVAMPSLA